MSSAVKVVALSLLVFVSGCVAAYRKMPLQENGAMPSLAQRSVLVMRVKMRNENHKTQQPKMTYAYATEKLQGGKGIKTAFWDPTLLHEADEGGKEYFVSLDVEPGTVRLDALHFWRFIPLLLSAKAELPLRCEVDVPASKVVYLGSLDSVIVPKTGTDQTAAGGPFPLVDQAVAGFSNGTWQYSVADDYDAAVPELKAKYPFLSDVEIEKGILALPGSPAKPPAAPSPPQASN